MSADGAAAAIATKLAGNAEDREAGYVLCKQLCERGARSPGVVEAAAQCVAPLCEVMTRDAAEVGPEEYQRAALVLYELFPLDAIRIGGEVSRTGAHNQTTVWAAGSLPPQRSALGVVLLKPPSELTAEDVMVVLAANVGHGICAPNGPFEEVFGSYYTWDEFIGTMMETDFMMLNSPGESEERNLRLTSLILALLKPDAELPDALLSAAHSTLAHLVIGRPTVGLHMLKENGLETLVENLRRTTPHQWLTTEGYAQPGHAGVAFWVMSEIVSAMCASGYDFTARLLECGYIDVCIDALRAIEELSEEVPLANHSVVFMVRSLVPINYGECLDQIQEKLRGATSALRCAIDRDITSIASWHFSTGLFGSLVAANLFGRDESEDECFVFAQKDLDALLFFAQEVLAPTTWGMVFSFAADFSRGLLSTCISDTNKTMLLNNSGFVPLLIEGLLLSDDCFRKDADDTVKASVQRDFAECIQQCSAYEAGVMALKQHMSAVMNALTALKDGGRAYTAEAKLCAEAALLALDPQLHRASADCTDQPDQLHVMMSYSWQEQPIVRRIVAELQARGFLVWFDLEQMKGSVMDRMSEAVEGADVILIGISNAYKESGNCRLEAQYAMQQKRDMIPLILQQGYQAKGWLGLILGSKMYYQFFPAAVATEVAFAERMDALTFEIGDRGKPKEAQPLVSEAVPPPRHAPAPAPAPAPAAAHFEPAPMRAPAPVPAPTPTAAVSTPPPHRSWATSAATSEQQGLSPTMPSCAPSSQLAMVSEQSSLPASAAAGVSLTEVSAFMTEQLDRQREHDEKLREEMVTLREAAVESRLRAQAAESKLREQAIEHRYTLCIEQQRQLPALQARLEALHAAKLLGDEDLYAVEDAIADSSFEGRSAPAQGEEEKEEEEGGNQRVARLIALSAKVTSDRAFARQLQRWKWI